MKMQWEEPPERVRAGGGQSDGYWADVVAELKEHPGRWAKIATRSSSNRSTYLKEHYGLEVTMRDWAADFYARWPEDEAER